MTQISAGEVVAARMKVDAMDLSAKELLLDDIYQQQPNLLAAVLVLNKFDVALSDIDIMLNLLLVCYQIKIDLKQNWPLITADDQERLNKQLREQIMQTEYLSASNATHSIQFYIDTHREKFLLAYAYDVIIQAGWLMQAEYKVDLSFAALGIIESITYAAHACKERR